MTHSVHFPLIALLAGAVCVLGAHASKAQTQEKAPNVVTVSGEGEVDVVPNVAIVTGGVTATARTARDASQANAKTMTAVMAAIKAAGVAERDVQTSHLSLQPMRDDDRAQPGRIVGFQAINQVTVEIRELAKTTDVIDRMVAAGANDISGIYFTVSAPSKLLDQAREAAIADARRKAEIYARAANVRLGAPVSISEEAGMPPRPFLMRSLEAASSTPISPGEETLRVSVTVSYELLR